MAGSEDVWGKIQQMVNSICRNECLARARKLQACLTGMLSQPDEASRHRHCACQTFSGLLLLLPVLLATSSTGMFHSKWEPDHSKAFTISFPSPQLAFGQRVLAYGAIMNPPGNLDNCEVFPALPVGLQIDKSTCTIHGKFGSTPNHVSTFHMVVAQRAIATASTQIEIVLLGDWPGSATGTEAYSLHRPGLSKKVQVTAASLESKGHCKQTSRNCSYVSAKKSEKEPSFEYADTEVPRDMRFGNGVLVVVAGQSLEFRATVLGFVATCTSFSWLPKDLDFYAEDSTCVLRGIARPAKENQLVSNRTLHVQACNMQKPEVDNMQNASCTRAELVLVIYTTIQTFQTSGACIVTENGACVESKHPTPHRGSCKSCSISAPAVPLDVQKFDILHGCGSMIVNDEAYSSISPHGVTPHTAINIDVHPNTESIRFIICRSDVATWSQVAPTSSAVALTTGASVAQPGSLRYSEADFRTWMSHPGLKYVASQTQTLIAPRVKGAKQKIEIRLEKPSSRLVVGFTYRISGQIAHIESCLDEAIWESPAFARHTASWVVSSPDVVGKAFITSFNALQSMWHQQAQRTSGQPKIQVVGVPSSDEFQAMVVDDATEAFYWSSENTVLVTLSRSCRESDASCSISASIAVNGQTRSASAPLPEIRVSEDTPIHIFFCSDVRIVLAGAPNMYE